MNSAEDREFSLSFNSQRAVVSALGGSLRRYFHVEPDGSESDIVWGYSGSENKIGGQGDVLIPFPSRIKDGGLRQSLARTNCWKPAPDARERRARAALHRSSDYSALLR